jgi:hypothetical protein
MWKHLLGEAPKLPDFVTNRPDEYLFALDLICSH